MIDHGIGEILEELDKQGLSENTIVIFAADHGDHAGQFKWFFKGNMYEGSIRIPLIIKDPTRQVTKGKKCSHIVNSIDLFATVLSQCGISDVLETHSRSLTPLLEQISVEDWDDSTYCEYVPEPESNNWMAIKGNYKILKSKTSDGKMVYEIYDRSNKPFDSVNLWDLKEHSTIQQEMALFLEEQEKRAKRLCC